MTTRNISSTVASTDSTETILKNGASNTCVASTATRAEVDDRSQHTQVGAATWTKGRNMGSCPLSNTANGVNAQLVSGLNLDDPRPDVQLVALPLSFYHPKMAPVLQHMIPEHAQAAFGFTTKQHSACITAIALHPSNYGEIKLASSDPFVHPLIDPKYLESAKDVEVLLFGLKTILKVANQKALRPYDFRFGEEPIPSCRQYKLLTDDYLRCHIEHRTATLYHPVSSCRMGPDPATSVVDNKLRVHGIHGLRVADASAFPDQVSGNTNTPTIMLAEKAAHIILEQYSSLP